MNNKIYGECFCGKIKYSLRGPIKPGRCCHCSKCRKAFSGAGSAMTFVQDNSIEWVRGEEDLKVYANQENIGLGFCSTCGSSIAALKGREVFGITLGTLNDDPEVIIKEHIFVGSKASWDHIGGTSPCYDEFPTDD